MKILQRNLNRNTFVVWEMKRNVSVVCVCSAPNCCDTEQRSASQPGSVASGTPYIIKCIIRLIKVTDCNNARWKPEIILYSFLITQSAILVTCKAVSFTSYTLNRISYVTVRTSVTAQPFHLATTLYIEWRDIIKTFNIQINSYVINLININGTLVRRQ